MYSEIWIMKRSLNLEFSKVHGNVLMSYNFINTNYAFSVEHTREESITPAWPISS